jgi:hypothetical protein
MSLNSLRVQRVRARHAAPLRLNRYAYDKGREYNAFDDKPKVEIFDVVKCEARSFGRAGAGLMRP